MAVDDIVNGIGEENTALTFQPASGVEVVVTSFHGPYATLLDIQLTDGVITTGRGGSTSTIVNPGNTKVSITNAIFLELVAFAANRMGFSGITTK